MAAAGTIDEQITFLYTRDLESTARFYEELLGLPLVLDQGSCRIYRATASAFLGFCERAEAPEQPQGIILTLVSDDVDGWYKTLRGRGVVFEKSADVNEVYQIYHCFLRDPNGYLVEIQRFLHEGWARAASA